jgi:DNA-binding response OmpR family regulator
VRILVVDDEGIVLNSCRRILEPEGYDVLSVRSADEALAAVEREDPFLLIVDIKMPGKDGITLVRELKKGKQPVPVILMSGYSTAETVAQAEAIGASRFIAKPFTPEELLEAVTAVIRKEVIDGNDKSPGN